MSCVVLILKPTDLVSSAQSTSSLQQWDEFSQFIINRAETEMKHSIELREAIVLTIAEVSTTPL